MQPLACRGLGVQIPPNAWMSVGCECSVLSSIHLRAKPIPRPEEYYRGWPRPEKRCCATGRKKGSPLIFKKPLGSGGGGFRGTPLYILNLGARGEWVVNATPRPLYPGKELLCTKDNRISILSSSKLANRITQTHPKLHTNNTMYKNLVHYTLQSNTTIFYLVLQ